MGVKEKKRKVVLLFADRAPFNGRLLRDLVQMGLELFRRIEDVDLVVGFELKLFEDGIHPCLHAWSLQGTTQ